MANPLPQILIAEDDPYMRRFFEALLVDLGAEITFVKDGHEALFRIAREPYDLILLDAVMPQMDGFEVCRMIKGVQAQARPRVLIVTALSGTAAERAWEAGADDFLSKGMPHFLIHARILHHLSPPPPRPGPVLAASPVSTVRHFLVSQAKQGGFGLSLADGLDDLVAPGEFASLVVVDMAFGFSEVKVAIGKLPMETPRILLFNSEDIPLLEDDFLPINDALQKPLSGAETRKRLKAFSLLSPKPAQQ